MSQQSSRAASVEPAEHLGDTSPSPFHEGEQRVQSRLGVREQIEPWARRVVRPYLPEEHRRFYAELPFLVLAARDAAGRPWATFLAEEPGFVSSPDPGTLRVSALPSPGDALAEALSDGDDIGFLGIELDTRRRNRVNGRLSGRDADAFDLSVEQSFGNCPQYITARSWKRAPAEEAPASSTRAASLSESQRELIRRADTFFIATGFRGRGTSETYGMDASHRGGAAGFVHIESENEIVFPDYAGNNHYNTIGNLLMDPRAGVLFVDFERGELLQLTGRARIDWDSPRLARFDGARRLVHLEIEEVVSVERALPIRWESPGAAVRELRVVDKQPESIDVTSFLFAARDGSPLPDFDPGQHLPIELAIAGESAPVRRTYSLSGATDGPHYRISVKRDPRGLASRHLHDHLEVGAILSAGTPQGTFVLHPPTGRPVVLVSAGVGLTPLVSMLHELAREEPERPVWFVHGARDGDHHPLRKEVERLAASASHVQLHIAYSQPHSADVAGRDYHSAGRVDAALLEQLVPGLDADYYLCGPLGFMAAIEAQLEARGVAAERLHSESFGPAA